MSYTLEVGWVLLLVTAAVTVLGFWASYQRGYQDAVSNGQTLDDVIETMHRRRPCGKCGFLQPRPAEEGEEEDDEDPFFDSARELNHD